MNCAPFSAPTLVIAVTSPRAARIGGRYEDKMTFSHRARQFPEACKLVSEFLRCSKSLDTTRLARADGFYRHHQTRTALANLLRLGFDGRRSNSSGSIPSTSPATISMRVVHSESGRTDIGPVHVGLVRQSPPATSPWHDDAPPIARTLRGYSCSTEKGLAPTLNSD